MRDKVLAAFPLAENVAASCQSRCLAFCQRARGGDLTLAHAREGSDHDAAVVSAHQNWLGMDESRQAKDTVSEHRYPSARGKAATGGYR